MTKKDYVIFAAMLARIRLNMPTDNFNEIVAEFVAIFKQDNPRFDDMRFTNAIFEGE